MLNHRILLPFIVCMGMANGFMAIATNPLPVRALTAKEALAIRGGADCFVFPMIDCPCTRTYQSCRATSCSGPGPCIATEGWEELAGRNGQYQFWANAAQGVVGVTTKKSTGSDCWQAYYCNSNCVLNAGSWICDNLTSLSGQCDITYWSPGDDAQGCTGEPMALREKGHPHWALAQMSGLGHDPFLSRQRQ